jgi:phytoene synthase
MTNIARDVTDDASGGRVYLPLDWLAEEGIEADGVADPRNRPALARVVRRFLGEADRYYRSAGVGIGRLDPRSAWAVAAASRVYGEIGRRVVARGEGAWDSRTVIGRWRKVFLAARAGLDSILARRGLGPGRPAGREGLWTRP